ncbi:hypothetical protein Tco_0457818 [Tanacetum coccineum]
MMRELKFFLGIQIHQSPRGIFINQAKYAQEILKKHGMTSCDSIGTPMATKHLDADLSGTSVDQMKYRSMVGALMYLTTSRPVIVHATCYCARYQAKPTEKHLTAVKRIFWYLKDTINMGLWYPKDTGFELTAFLDSDHTGCLDSRKSTSGGIQFLGGDKLVSWSSKKKGCTSLSSAEAEYHFIKEQVEKGFVELFFVGTEYQLADLFTKALSEDRFKYLVRRLGMRCLTLEELETFVRELAAWLNLIHSVLDDLRFELGKPVGGFLYLPDHGRRCMLASSSEAQDDRERQIKMIQVKEMMQDKDLKNSKSKDKGSRSRSRSMNEQSHYKQEKTKTRPKKAKLKCHIVNVGEIKKDLNIRGDC